MVADELLTPKQVAHELGVSVQTLAVWRCERRYNLRYIKVGACVRYKRSDVERFLEAAASDNTKGRRGNVR